MKKRKRNQRRTLLRVLEILCGILFVVALILLILDIQVKNNIIKSSESSFSPASTYEEAAKTQDLQIDWNATEERTAETIKQDKNVSIPGCKTMSFKADSEIVSVDLYNPESNTGYYYLTFELRVPDSNGQYETLYNSDLVEAGKHLYQITLKHALSEGIYEHCILHVQPYTVDNLKPTNNADIEFTLTVQ